MITKNISCKIWSFKHRSWERRWMGGFTPQATFQHNYQMWEGEWGNSPDISPLVSDGGKEGGWGDSPTSLRQYEMEGTSVDGGISPHLFVNIRWREGRWMGGLPDTSMKYQMAGKKVDWGDSPISLCKYQMEGMKVNWGIPPTSLHQNQKGERWKRGLHPNLSVNIRW